MRLIMIVCLAGLVAIVPGFAEANIENLPTIHIGIHQETVSIWVPQTPQQYRQGLKYVDKSTLTGKGMLFSYRPNVIPSFTMQDTLTDIDLLCLNRRGILLQVIVMKKGVIGPYQPTMPCRFALELSAGSMKRYHLSIGDKIDWLPR